MLAQQLTNHSKESVPQLPVPADDGLNPQNQDTHLPVGGHKVGRLGQVFTGCNNNNNNTHPHR